MEIIQQLESIKSPKKQLEFLKLSIQDNEKKINYFKENMSAKDMKIIQKLESVKSSKKQLKSLLQLIHDTNIEIFENNTNTFDCIYLIVISSEIREKIEILNEQIEIEILNKINEETIKIEKLTEQIMEKKRQKNIKNNGFGCKLSRLYKKFNR